MSNSKKPELVEKVEEQVGGDAKAAFSFLGQAMNAFLGYDPDTSVKKAMQEKQQKAQVQQSMVPTQVQAQQGPHCNVCGGKREVGRLGYEVPCPACQPNNCNTCKGSGKLGTPGYEIDCPMCQIQAGIK